ncbi:hypothetical protein VSH64_04220 [Amycolatopsis rhabdoformis]|uniref:DUF4288 domain-containing protein n=1 Tax=Amycolatopsis rhabdoformis TaxID=1448059 RepID=A0ABZ1IC66_9PSEU|nr:hypothetical protein [Amycolatopsis rhabdoformis]WSE31316.1 hypothetical protein VSH64_04220 [Amycolatopsis rhabdoformis]
MSEVSRWYAVRCVFRWQQWEGSPFEERITLWQAPSSEAAIEAAEREAGQYAAEHSVTYLGFAQSYALDESVVLGSGAEVFSLLRDSPLAPEEYLTRFFNTGGEHQGVVDSE